jgi:hypothetical protein
MTEPPSRNCFQIHLSTAIVLMFVAGGLMWTNFQNGTVHFYYGGKEDHVSYYGWPGAELLASPSGVGDYVTDDGFISETYLIRGCIVIDCLVGIMILFTTLIFCEWLIRRRVARKEFEE